ncbi:MAG: pseudouridine-5'-phosphate glycosidase [bacterium]
MADWDRFMELSLEVAEALAQRRPLVLMESAFVSHGLPAEIAVQTAEDMSAEAADEGALPAATAVLDGRIVIGAASDVLRPLTAGDAVKVAERDLATAVALRQTGGTTVSATVAIASLLGAPVVATGGIGGVHLGAEQTWDVSADLSALASHPIIVVCAGAKAICDIPKTLEFLETAGVTVVGFRTDRFPYFLAADSGSLVPRRVDSPEDAAGILAAKQALGQRTGLVVANPVPAPAALDRSVVTGAVTRARREAGAAGTIGADVTPFLLAALASITDGASLRANVALLRANARLAARIAVALSVRGGTSSA